MKDDVSPPYKVVPLHPSVSFHTVDLSWFVRRLINIRAHELVGMEPAEYAAVWPRVVQVPNVIRKFYRGILLVDRTVDIERLALRSGLDVRLPWSIGDLPDLAPPMVDGRPLKRYVALVSYEDPRDERELVTGFDAPMALAEALWLPLLHPASGAQKRTMLAKPPLPDGTHPALVWGRGRGPYLTSVTHPTWRETPGLALRAHHVIPVD